jgi:hypothetical protein
MVMVRDDDDRTSVGSKSAVDADSADIIVSIGCLVPSSFTGTGI